MKRLLAIVTVISMMINQESGMANTPIHAVAPTPNAIKNARVHGKPKARLKTTLRTIPYNPEEIVIDDDVVLARNHNRLELVNEQEEELSDHVKIRLMIARMKALQKYQEVWQT